jgi:telomere length regulation protein
MTSDEVRELVNRFASPVPDLTTLCSLLCSPLERIGLLPSPFRRFNVEPLPDSAEFYVPKYIPLLQRALLEHVAPTWQATLDEENMSLLLQQYFCPDSFSFAISAAGQVALFAYSSILSLPLGEFSIQLLARLSKDYPIDKLHSVLFSRNDPSAKLVISWEDCIRNVLAVPAKVANALGERGVVPQILEHRAYFNNVSIQCEALIHSISSRPARGVLCSVGYVSGPLNLQQTS